MSLLTQLSIPHDSVLHTLDRYRAAMPRASWSSALVDPSEAFCEHIDFIAQLAPRACAALPPDTPRWAATVERAA